MTKAVMYLRVSGASELDGTGNTEMDARPAFMNMLADLLSNGCRTIIVERLDRLAREFRVQEELLLYHICVKQLT